MFLHFYYVNNHYSYVKVINYQVFYKTLSTPILSRIVPRLLYEGNLDSCIPRGDRSPKNLDSVTLEIPGMTCIVKDFAYPANLFKNLPSSAITMARKMRNVSELININYIYNCLSLSVFTSLTCFFAETAMRRLMTGIVSFIVLSRRGSNTMVKVNANRRREMRQAPNFSVGRM